MNTFNTVIFDEEHADGHKHYDQAPRFHAKDILNFAQKESHFEFIYTDFSLSEELYRDIYDGNVDLIETDSYKKPENKKSLFFPKQNIHNILLSDTENEKKGGNYSCLSYQAEKLIKETNGNVFIYLNRKGFARSLVCESCNHIEMCPTCNVPYIFSKNKKSLICNYCRTEKPVHLTCSSCKSGILKCQGFGTELVEETLKKLFPEKQVFRMENNPNIGEFTKSHKNAILIGTKGAFSFLEWNNFDLFLFLDIDRELALAEFANTEKLWHLIHKVQFKKKTEAKFLIQSKNPEHLLFRSLGAPDLFYRNDLSLRKNLDYPPYSYITRIFFGHKNPETAKKAAENLFENMSKLLTKSKKSIIIEYPFALHPDYYRNAHWQCIVFRSKKETIEKDLLFLNQFVPANWKSDPNPISLFSH